MTYAIEIVKSARKELEKLPAKHKRQVAGEIDRLAGNPRPQNATKLTDRGNEYRLKCGNYRVLYCIFDARLVVLVIAVGDRKDIYKKR